MNSRHHPSSSSSIPHTHGDVAPMYITIGPQCCGKSTFLRHLESSSSSSSSTSRTSTATATTNHQQDLVDVSLDDQPGVYLPVSTDLWLRVAASGEKPTTGHGGDNRAFSSQERTLLRQVHFGKTTEERIREDSIEVSLVLQRWKGNLTSHEFAQRLGRYYRQRNLSDQLTKTVVDAVETFLAKSARQEQQRPLPPSRPPPLPEQVDVFVLEALFQPDSVTNQTAIQRAYRQLESTPRHLPVAWGNTNSKARDFQVALDIARQTNRPVHFVLCHPDYSDKSNTTTTNNNNSTSSATITTNSNKTACRGSVLTLPWLSLEDLLQRNLKRLATSGRYIPSFAIADCRQRITTMIPPHNGNLGGGGSHYNEGGNGGSNFINNNNNATAVEQILVSLASTRYDDYVMTNNRLIEKHRPNGHNGHHNQHNQMIGGYNNNGRHQNGHQRYGNGGGGRGRGRGGGGSRPRPQQQQQQQRW